MQGTLKDALKHAAVGSITAVVVNRASQYVFSSVAPYVVIKDSPSTSAILIGVTGGCVGTAGLLIGEQFLTRMIANDDPLFHMVYFFAVMRNQSNPIYGFSNAGTSVLAYLMDSMQNSGNQKPPAATTMAMNNVSVPAPAKCSDCKSKNTNCSGCSH